MQDNDESTAWRRENKRRKEEERKQRELEFDLFITTASRERSNTLWENPMPVPMQEVKKKKFGMRKSSTYIPKKEFKKLIREGKSKAEINFIKIKRLDSLT